MQYRRLTDLDLAGKRVFIRADLNVPQDDALAITDDTRIRASLPAIRIELNPRALFKYGIGLEDVRAAVTGANVSSPTCSVTSANCTPFSRSSAIRRGVKCSPAVGAAAEPGLERN